MQYVTAQSAHVLDAIRAGSDSQTSQRTFLARFSSSILRIIFARVVFLGRPLIPSGPSPNSALHWGQTIGRSFDFRVVEEDEEEEEPSPLVSAGDVWLEVLGRFRALGSELLILLLSWTFRRHCLQKVCAQGNRTGAVNISRQMEQMSSSVTPWETAILGASRPLKLVGNQIRQN